VPGDGSVNESGTSEGHRTSKGHSNPSASDDGPGSGNDHGSDRLWSRKSGVRLYIPRRM
jgi:hypothetical protein